MANIYDVAGNMQHAQPVTAYMQGVQYRNSLADLAAKRAEQARQDEIRNGLMQFYRQAQPEQVQTTAQGPDLMAMAQQGANMGPMAGLGVMRDAPKYMPRADYLGQLASVMPQMRRQTIPAQPGGFDYTGAADYLASKGDFESTGALAKLRELTQPQRAKFYGGDGQEVIGADGKRKLIAMTEAGPVELPYQPVSKPKYKFMEDGTVVDESSMNVVGRIPVGLSPAQQLQWRIAMGSQNKPQMVTGADGQVYWVSPGQQLPQGTKAASGASTAAPSEDERKAAGWKSQMDKAISDMDSATAMQSDSSKPGIIESLPLVPDAAKNMSRSPARQKFVQASGAFAEAALRAATGAGINESEAKQKISELTPQLGDSDEVIKQKRASLYMYLDSVTQRAGRALKAPASASATPRPAGPVKSIAPGQKPSLNDIFGGM